MKRLIGHLMERIHKPVFDSLIQGLLPDAPFFAIGDIHGSTPLVAKILEQIDASGQTNCPVVFLGDYVDRGDDTAGTLEQLRALSQDCTRPYIFLRGNHEQMLLDFLDAPAITGPFWLSSGGRHTLASYGLSVPYSGIVPKELEVLRDKLRLKMGPNLEDWLRSLPLSWQTGNVFLSHAGTDSTRDLDEQTNEALLWGHADAPFVARRDGMWTVQGHIIVDKPTVVAGRMFIDTGAYATGQLTAAQFDTDEVHFFSTYD